MQVRYRKGVAIHPDPESRGDARESAAEALTGEPAGQPLSREIGSSGVPTLLSEAEGHAEGGAMREPSEDSTRSKTLSARGSSLHRNWEISSVPAERLVAGGLGKADGRTLDLDAGEKSDACVVPMNDPNKGDASKPAPAEGREGRRAAKGNARQSPRAPDSAPDPRVDGTRRRT
jgi:hypothetical protein